MFIIAANITLKTHTRYEDAVRINDKNGTTCLELSGEGNQLKLVSEFHAEFPFINNDNNSLDLEIVIKPLECSNSIVFFEYHSDNTCGQMRKVYNKVGEILTPLPNEISCYYRLPVGCDENQNKCQFNGYFAINTTASSTIEVCDLQQA